MDALMLDSKGEYAALYAHIRAAVQADPPRTYRLSYVLGVINDAFRRYMGFEIPLPEWDPFVAVHTSVLCFMEGLSLYARYLATKNRRVVVGTVADAKYVYVTLHFVDCKEEWETLDEVKPAQALRDAAEYLLQNARVDFVHTENESDPSLELKLVRVPTDAVEICANPFEWGRWIEEFLALAV